ncbi:right-handed parallel beta-helix repeat-containing protein [Saccharicrinis aurantiacus]|uniref:right-handed parallel beta-helix repeat-containing protein n=1 Tax=Saccharicrinis aurantiacus TaxID=1849719 RepID=UPI000950048E|nr:right-handed parallel beta-helix repeat-containing protein [Saccharicrinis aurantiacus]
MKITQICISTFLLSILLTISSCVTKEPRFLQVMFDTSIKEDATPAVLAKMMKAKELGSSEVQFEKGTYHFYPDKGKEFYCFISNHCNVMVRTAFPITGLDNLTIDGQGSTFIFHGVMIPFLVDESTNITVKNLSIDWNDTFHSEGLIVANDEKNGTFDMQISDDYPYVIRNQQLVFIKEYYEHTLGQTILYDPTRKAIIFGSRSYTPLTAYKKLKVKHNLDKINYKYEIDPRAPKLRGTQLEDRLIAKEIKPGLVRIYNHRRKLPQVGMILSAKGEQGYNRVAPAFRVTNTKTFNAENVNVHHAGGMGIIAENSEDLTLDDFNVTPSHGRMVSTTADATHFVGCRGKVILRNCTFNNQLDDASNVHGTYQKVVDILDDNRLGVRMGHDQQQGFTIGRPNDTIGLVRLTDSFFPYGKASIKSIEYINSRYQIITFNEPLPKNIKAGDLLENLDAYPELLVENCNISRNRARGLLLSTPKKTLIKNNFFHTEKEALLIPVESGYWYESGSSSNLTITNNEFKDCSHGGQNRGIIRFETDDDNQNIAFRNIVISNNKIDQFDNWILEIANTDGLKFTGNTIVNNGGFPQLYPHNPAISIKTSKNIVFENNTYKGKAKVIIETKAPMKEIKFQ